MPITMLATEPASNTLPRPPAWASQVEELLAPLRPILAERDTPLRIAEPCVGIGNSTDALHQMGFKTTCGPMWDLQTCVRPALMGLFLDGRAEPEQIHLGHAAGNIMAQSFDKVPDVDGLCAGPPCPPWSSLGPGLSLNDPRAGVFFKVISLIGHLRRNCKTFRFVLLENVSKILHKRKHEPEAPIERILRALRAAVQDWQIGFWRMKHAVWTSVPTGTRGHLGGTGAGSYTSSFQPQAATVE